MLPPVPFRCSPDIEDGNQFHVPFQIPKSMLQNIPSIFSWRFMIASQSRFFGNCAPWIPWIKGSGDNQTFNIQSSIQQLKLRGGSIVVSISFSMCPRFPARRFGSLIVNIAQSFCSTQAQFSYPVAVWHHFLVSKC